MATMSAPRRTRLRRDPEHGMLGGVCAGIARELRVDPIVVRVAFVAAAVAGGIGVVVYLLAWALTPAAGGGGAPARRLRTGRGAVEVALGVGFLLLSVLLILRATGIWFSDAVVWPNVTLLGGRFGFRPLPTELSYVYCIMTMVPRGRNTGRLYR